jgi:hypothetical protein
LENDNSILYSDRHYKGLYHGVAEDLPLKFTVYKYTYDDLKQNGAILYDGIDHFLKNVIDKIVNISILIPEKYLNNDSKLHIFFDHRITKQSLNCQTFQFIYQQDDNVQMINGNINEFSITIPKEWQKNNYLYFALYFPCLDSGLVSENSSEKQIYSNSYYLKGLEITDVSTNIDKYR